MRHGLAFTAALFLSACTTETVTYVEVPVPTAKPAYATSVRPGGQRLMTVDRLYAWCEKGLLVLQVTASALLESLPVSTEAGRFLMVSTAVALLKSPVRVPS